MKTKSQVQPAVAIQNALAFRKSAIALMWLAQETFAEACTCQGPGECCDGCATAGTLMDEIIYLEGKPAALTA